MPLQNFEQVYFVGEKPSIDHIQTFEQRGRGRNMHGVRGKVLAWVILSSMMVTIKPQTRDFTQSSTMIWNDKLSIFGKIILSNK